MTVSPSEVFAGPVAALPAAVFLGIVVIAVVISGLLGVLVCARFQGFRSVLWGSVFWFLMSVLFFSSVDIFKFLLRKKGWLSFG